MCLVTGVVRASASSAVTSCITGMWYKYAQWASFFYPSPLKSAWCLGWKWPSWTGGAEGAPLREGNALPRGVDWLRLFSNPFWRWDRLLPWVWPWGLGPGASLVWEGAPWLLVESPRPWPMVVVQHSSSCDFFIIARMAPLPTPEKWVARTGACTCCW